LAALAIFIGLTAAYGAEIELALNPFDSSTVPVLDHLPAGLSAYENRYFGELDRQDENLVRCDWRGQSLAEARATARRLSYVDLMPPNSKFQGPLADLLAPIARPIGQALRGARYGAIDQSDLWISPEWSSASLEGVMMQVPQNAEQLLHGKEVDIGVTKEQVMRNFKHPESVFITARITPPTDERRPHAEGIIFLAGADLVKFKELYGAAQTYCTANHRTNTTYVTGWQRSCFNLNPPPGVSLPAGSLGQITMITVGFICS
jgi:hypothetical protein